MSETTSENSLYQRISRNCEPSETYDEITRDETELLWTFLEDTSVIPLPCK